MRPRRFPEANLVYELPGGNEDNSLWCERVQLGRIYSEWELTDDERQAIAAGARIWLQIWNEPIPPVSLGVVSRDSDGVPTYVEEAS